MAQDEFDDLDMDMNMDMGFDSADTGSRAPAKPSKQVMKGVTSGLKQGSKASLQHAVDSLSPNTASLARNMISTSTQEWGNLREEMRKSLGPEIQTIRSAGSSILNRISRSMPGPIKSRLESLSKKIEGERTAAPSQEEQQASESTQVLQEVFETQAQLQLVQDKKDELHRQYDKATEKERFIQQLAISGKMTNQLISINQFHLTTFTRYLKADLTLKYKHFFIAKNTFSVISALSKVLETKLEEIKHNTALPDMRKMTMGDARWEMSRKPFRDYISNFGTNLLKNLRTKLVDTASMGVGGLSMVLGGINMQQEMDETMGEKKSAVTSLTSSLIKSLIGSRAGKGIAKIAQNKYTKTGIGALEELSGAVPKEAIFKLQEMANQGGILGNILQSILPGMGKGKNPLPIGLKESGKLVPFDLATRRSIVEIIPGYLSMMQRDISKIAGNKNAQRLVYNPDTGQFTTVEDYKAHVLKSAFGDEADRSTSLHEAYGIIEGTAAAKFGDEGQQSAKNLSAIINKMLVNLALHRKFFMPEYIKKYLDGDGSTPYISALLHGMDIDEARPALEFLVSVAYPDGKHQDRLFRSRVNRKIASQMDKHDLETIFLNLQVTGQESLFSEFYNEHEVDESSLTPLFESPINTNISDSMATAMKNKVQKELDLKDVLKRKKDEYQATFNRYKENPNLLKQEIKSKVDAMEVELRKSLTDNKLVKYSKEQWASVRAKLEKSPVFKEVNTKIQSTFTTLNQGISSIRNRINKVKSVEDARALAEQLGGDIKKEFDVIATKASESEAVQYIKDQAKSKLQALEEQRIKLRKKYAESNAPDNIEEFKTNMKTLLTEIGDTDLQKQLESAKSFIKEKAEQARQNIPKPPKKSLRDWYTALKQKLNKKSVPELAIDETTIEPEIAPITSEPISPETAPLVNPQQAISTPGVGDTATPLLMSLLEEAKTTNKLLEKVSPGSTSESAELSTSSFDPIITVVKEFREERKEGDDRVIGTLGQITELVGIIANQDRRNILTRIGANMWDAGKGVGKFLGKISMVSTKGVFDIGRIATTKGLEGLFKSIPFLADVTKKGLGVGGKLGKGILDINKEVFQGIFNFITRKKSKTKIKFVDIYKKGEIIPGNPLLTAKQQREGVYFADGTTVNSSSDIDQPVLDKEGNTLISKEDVDGGLVDLHGNNITTTTFVMKSSGLVNILQSLAGGIPSLIKTAGSILTGGKDLYGGLLKGAKSLGGDLWGGAKVGLKRMLGLATEKDVVTRLDKLITLISARTLGMDKWLQMQLATAGANLEDLDNNGFRDNSWQEQDQEQEQGLIYDAYGRPIKSKTTGTSTNATSVVQQIKTQGVKGTIKQKGEAYARQKLAASLEKRFGGKILGKYAPTLLRYGLPGAESLAGGAVASGAGSSLLSGLLPSLGTKALAGAKGLKSVAGKAAVPLALAAALYGAGNTLFQDQGKFDENVNALGNESFLHRSLTTAINPVKQGKAIASIGRLGYDTAGNMIHTARVNRDVNNRLQNLKDTMKDKLQQLGASPRQIDDIDGFTEAGALGKYYRSIKSSLSAKVATAPPTGTNASKTLTTITPPNAITSNAPSSNIPAQEVLARPEILSYMKEQTDALQALQKHLTKISDNTDALHTVADNTKQIADKPEPEPSTTVVTQQNILPPNPTSTESPLLNIQGA